MVLAALTPPDPSTSADADLKLTVVRSHPQTEDAARALWSSLAEPGSWWSSRDRVSMVREARMARECVRCLRDSESGALPVVGRGHTRATLLDPELIDLSHVIARFDEPVDQSWYERKTKRATTPSSYLEAVATVAIATALDDLALEEGELPLIPTAVDGPRHPKPDGRIGYLGAWLPGLVGGERLSERLLENGFSERALTQISAALAVSPPSFLMVNIIVNVLMPAEGLFPHWALGLIRRIATAVGIAVLQPMTAR